MSKHSHGVNVLELIDDLIDFEERHAEYERRTNYEARSARAAVADLIDRVDYLCRTGEGMLMLRLSLGRVTGEKERT